MIGIDFGTTNSTVARVNARGEVQCACYPGAGTLDPLFRSALFFPDPELVQSGEPYVYLGRQAVEHYEHEPESGRLIRSLKTFLTTESVSTRIFEKEWTIEALLALLVRSLVKFSEQALGPLEGAVVVGRPVQFVRQHTPADEQRALERLRKAFSLAGLSSIQFELEPIAAAYTYERTLDHDEVVLVGDFGGGTSDFSVVKVGPRSAALPPAQRVLASSGVGIAGDVLDGRLIYNAVTPLLGAGKLCRNTLTGSESEVPRWFYTLLSDPARHFMLREAKSLQLLGQCMSEAPNAETRRELEALETIITEGLTYQLFHTAGGAKARLSNSSQAEFNYHFEAVRLALRIQSASFERWITPDVEVMLQTADRMLNQASIRPEHIDRIFLTGGTAQVPLIQKAFARRFGEGKIARMQGFFTSVAEGLALRACQVAKA